MASTGWMLRLRLRLLRRRRSWVKLLGQSMGNGCGRAFDIGRDDVHCSHLSLPNFIQGDKLAAPCAQLFDEPLELHERLAQRGEPNCEFLLRLCKHSCDTQSPVHPPWCRATVMRLLGWSVVVLPACLLLYC